MTRWTTAALVGALLWSGAAGCAPPLSTRKQMLNRAVYDLRCAKRALNVTTIDTHTLLVDGCGQQATYVYVCDERRCAWLLNGGPRSST